MPDRVPRTPEEIRSEIAELVRRRDKMLARAPLHVFAGRAIMPLVFLPTLLGLSFRLTSGRASVFGVLIQSAICLIAGSACYKLWRPGFDRHDLWAASDRVGYEGDSPRDLQRKIDALEAELSQHGV